MTDAPAPLTRAAIEQIQAKAEKATPGPWTTQRTSSGGVLLKRGKEYPPAERHPQTHLQVVPEVDGEFIAACDPQTIQALCVLALRGLERPTCATCRHNHDAQSGVSLEGQYRTLCVHPKSMDANKGAMMMTPWPFGCSLHEPKPAITREDR